MINEKEQSDREKLSTMKQEYERYKELWGLNLQYSHSAGPTQNYSGLESKYKIFLMLVSAEKKRLELQVVHIYFDTSTFDQVVKDVKVVNK